MARSRSRFPGVWALFVATLLLVALPTLGGQQPASEDATAKTTQKPTTVEWRFDKPQPGWKAVTPRPLPAGIGPATVSQTDGARPINEGLYEMLAGATRFVGDDTVQTYQLGLTPRAPGKGRGTRPEESPWKGPMKQLVLELWGRGPVEAEILSITVVPAARDAAHPGLHPMKRAAIEPGDAGS